MQTIKEQQQKPLGKKLRLYLYNPGKEDFS